MIFIFFFLGGGGGGAYFLNFILEFISRSLIDVSFQNKNISFYSQKSISFIAN